MSDKTYNDAQGTTHANYSPPGDAPFTCGECVHFHRFGGARKQSHHTTRHGGECDHPDVLKDMEASEIPTSSAGKPLVQAGGCCRYQK
jgi:hypothetical protein